MSIESRKTYFLPTNQGRFKLYVSAHKEGYFVASILHWTLTKDRLLKVPGDLGFMNADLETRIGSTEQAAVTEVLDWAKSKFLTVGEPALIEEQTA
jgi:hypothetical protein